MIITYTPESAEDGEIVDNLRAFVSGAQYTGLVVSDAQEAYFNEALEARSRGSRATALSKSRSLRALRLPPSQAEDKWVTGPEAERVARMREALKFHGIELAGDMPELDRK